MQVGYGIFAVSVFISIPYVPLALDLLMPLNESRYLVFPYYANYFFIDEVKYHYVLFTFHGAITLSLATLVATATDSMFVANVKHNCALFAIVW